MARRRVKMEYIRDESTRKVSYNKRVKGLVKKTQELSILCGVGACAVIYGPCELVPVVWPSSEVQARQILMDYKQNPGMDYSQRRFDQKAFLMRSTAKSEEKLLRLQRRRREMEMENIMCHLFSGKPIEQIAYADVSDLIWVIEDKLGTVQHRIRALAAAAAAAAAANPPEPTE